DGWANVAAIHAGAPVVPTKELPQCLHFRASISTSSAHSGHFLWVCGSSAPLDVIRNDLCSLMAPSEVLTGGKHTTRINARTGLTSNERTNRFPLARPRVLAITATPMDAMTQNKKISMPPSALPSTEGCRANGSRRIRNGHEQLSPARGERIGNSN